MYEGKALREKLQRGEKCLGTWIQTGDPFVTEALCSTGFDFFIIDAEHIAMDIETVRLHLLATKGSAVEPLVRVAWNDAVLIKRVLDAGAAGVLVPLIRTADDARAAVAACLYPPAGIRGFGPMRPSDYGRKAFGGYIQAANDSLVIWVQIEHMDAVNHIEAIMQVERLDGVLIGSNDLSGSLGLLGQPRHPQVLEAIGKVIAAGRKLGKPVGIAGPSNPSAAYEWLTKGIQFITLGADIEYIVTGSHTALSGVRALLKS